MLQIDVITLFPDFFESPLRQSIIGKALNKDKAKVDVHDLRQFGLGKHQITDDRPYGGGPGMVMLVEPIDLALQSLNYQRGKSGELIALTSAKGKLFSQDTAGEWSKLKRLCLICGHYEGVDERVAEHLIDTEIRIGDYVLTGGEPASLVILDSLIRLQPEVLGNQDSLQDESHAVPGQLSYPQYSRPEVYRDWTIPEVLKGGHHQEIAKWRQQKTKQVSQKDNLNSSK